MPELRNDLCVHQGSARASAAQLTGPGEVGKDPPGGAHLFTFFRPGLKTYLHFENHSKNTRNRLEILQRRSALVLVFVQLEKLMKRQWFNERLFIKSH